MAGVGIRAIQEALGHKSLAMTVRYAHLSPDFLQEAIDKLVPPQPEGGTQNPTDTRTDTAGISDLCNHLPRVFTNSKRSSNIPSPRARSSGG